MQTLLQGMALLFSGEVERVGYKGEKGEPRSSRGDLRVFHREGGRVCVEPGKRD